MEIKANVSQIENSGADAPHVRGGVKVILGLGKTGLSCARYFSRLGVPFRVMDANAKPDLLVDLTKFVSLSGFSQFDDATLFSPSEVDELIVSPGIPLSNQAIQRAIADGIGVNGDVNIFLERAAAPVIGITGSNGKSTVTALLGEILQNSGLKVGVGGNIGTPCLDLLETECDIYVLELSSYQLEVVQDARCEIAAVLNLSPDHLDRYESDVDYYATKAKIYSSARIALRNSDLNFDFLFDQETEILTFSANKPSEQKAYGIIEDGSSTYLCQGSRKIVGCDQILMQGRHNAQNALAAIAIAERLEVPTEVIVNTLSSFKGLPHRCEFVAKHEVTTFINDSKSTNPGSTIAAIHGLANSASQLVVLLGGQSKGADFTPLKAAILTTKSKVLLYGQDAEILEKSLAGCLTTRVSTLVEALEIAISPKFLLDVDAEGIVILFSPACASFDQFRNFEERGETFRALVQGVTA
ncbi:MAG: UDP-N-acetylmuramoylalanine--D-glutamate ligase [Candidatus Azotimanducaceae bacterium]